MFVENNPKILESDVASFNPDILILITLCFHLHIMSERGNQIFFTGGYRAVEQTRGRGEVLIINLISSVKS